jgi:hypothetical protein
MGAVSFLISFSTVIMLILFQSCTSYKSFKNSTLDGAFTNPSINPSIKCPTPVLEHTTIRKLSNSELSNTLQDLLQISDDVTRDLPPDPNSGEGFSNNGDLLKTTIDYMTVLLPKIELALSKAITAGSSTFKCAATKDATCAQSLITAFSQKAFRRPATSTEITNMMKLFNDQKATGATFEESLSAAYARALLSPYFLFRTSYDGNTYGNGIVGLSGHEFATRLSYFLWNSSPDQRLLDLAAQGSLFNESMLRTEIERLLKDEKAKRFTDMFVGQWLGIERVLYSGQVSRVGLTDELRKDLVTETKMFTAHVFRDGTSMSDLMTADYSFLNQRLAEHYGISGVVGTDFRKVSLSGTGRRGLLTQGAFLTLQSSTDYTVPTSRGNKILNLVVCAPPPPFNQNETVTQLTNNDPNLTIRQRLEIHRADPKCAGCHRDMDPIGLGLENFDFIGKFRATYANGLNVEPYGDLRGIQFKDASDLMNVINAQNDYKRCIAKNVMAYAIGRSMTTNDQCTLQQIGNLAVQPDKTFTDLVMSIVTSDQFRFNDLTK